MRKTWAGPAFSSVPITPFHSRNVPSSVGFASEGPVEGDPGAANGSGPSDEGYLSPESAQEHHLRIPSVNHQSFLSEGK